MMQFNPRFKSNFSVGQAEHNSFMPQLNVCVDVNIPLAWTQGQIWYSVALAFHLRKRAANLRTML